MRQLLKNFIITMIVSAFALFMVNVILFLIETILKSFQGITQ